MIVHTALDLNYCKIFGHDYVDNIRQYIPDALVSMVMVNRDLDLCGITADLVYHDPKDFQDIVAEFGTVQDRQAYGYYPLSRFRWLPVTGHDVMVRDIDTLIVRAMDQNQIAELLEQYDVVNLVRRRRDGSTGGIGAFIISHRVCLAIKTFTESLLAHKKLYWTLDEEIKRWCQSNLRYTELVRYAVCSNDPEWQLDDDTWILHAAAHEQLKLPSFEKIKKFCQPMPAPKNIDKNRQFEQPAG
jgi:hypothetical protein